MTSAQALILGIVQGLTEFLPVSSSGHLVLVQEWMGIHDQPLLFDVTIHTATLLAILMFLRKELASLIGDLFRGRRDAFVIVGSVIVGTLPAVIVGLFWYDAVQKSFGSQVLLVGGFFFNAIILVLPSLFPSWFNAGARTLSSQGYARALFIGCAQALSILPSISRSGTTIVTALGVKLNRVSAFLFSFYLFIPAVLGAQLLTLAKENSTLIPPVALAAGFIASFLTGLLALALLRNIFMRGKMWYFSVYSLVLGFLLATRLM